ncbi:alpha/beta fold hydrolase [Achromobacter marplatensis]
MTGSTWEDTPDGRAGWHDYFMRRGFDTLLCDAVERGRAGWPVPGTFTAGTPEARTLEQAWDLFRLGSRDEHGQWRPHESQLFPTENMEQFGRQFVPRWTAHRQLAVQAYSELLRRIGPGVVIAHSEGGRLAQEVAQATPGLIKALVLIEPAGGADPQDLHALQDMPVCAVWGDFFSHSALWQEYRKSFDTWAQAMQGAGGRLDTLDLPRLSMRGNSHFPMMDRNNLQVADVVLAWLRRAVPHV